MQAKSYAFFSSLVLFIFSLTYSLSDRKKNFLSISVSGLCERSLCERFCFFRSVNHNILKKTKSSVIIVYPNIAFGDL